MKQYRDYIYKNNNNNSKNIDDSYKMLFSNQR